jgi:hypothetical protein
MSSGGRPFLKSVVDRSGTGSATVLASGGGRRSDTDRRAASWLTDVEQSRKCLGLSATIARHMVPEWGRSGRERLRNEQLSLTHRVESHSGSDGRFKILPHAKLHRPMKPLAGLNPRFCSRGRLPSSYGFS